MNVGTALSIAIGPNEDVLSFVKLPKLHQRNDEPVAWQEEEPPAAGPFFADRSSSSDSVDHPLLPLAAPRSLQQSLLQGCFPTNACASVELKAHVDALVNNARPTGQKDLPSLLISPQHYYPLWCVLLCTTAGLAHGMSFDAETGVEDPKSGLYNVPVLAMLLGQAGDAKITYDGAREALAGKEQMLEDCRVYLAAVSGLQALETLKEAKPNPADLKLIEDAKATLQALADARKSTFLSCLSPKFLAPRCALAWWRDVVFGSASLAKVVPTTTVAIMSASGPLQGAAKDLATTLPYLSSAIGMVTGVLHLVQAVFEGKDARSSRAALLKAELCDKHLFLGLLEQGLDADGVVCQDLLDLLGHRSRERGLTELLGADLTEAHSWVRGIYGGTSLGGAVVTTILTALGGAALIGAAGMSGIGLVGVALAGAYMLWFGIKSHIATQAQKAHDKARRTAEAVHGRDANSMPGMATAHQGRPLEAIASSMVARLKQEATQADALRMLKAMEISHPAIDAAIHATDGSHDQALIERIVQWGTQTVSGSEKEALRRFYARPDVPASDKLATLEQWVGLGNRPEDIVQKPQEGLPWARHLAKGDGMGDLGRSSLTPSLIKKHWGEKGFQSTLNRALRHDCAVMFADAMALATTEEEKQQIASQGLEVLRFERQHKAKVRATVAGWVRDGLWGNMQLSLKDDLATLEHRRVLVDDYGISPDKGQRNVPGILAALQQHALKQPLQTDTLPEFMAICKASDGDHKRKLAAKVRDFVDHTIRSMSGAVEDAEVCAALGVRSLEDINEHLVDAVLPVLQQFLSVSEKLRAQTLPKVVASLHAYPTGGFPPALCRLAALRELRLRCEKADGAPSDRQNIQRALVLIKPLLKQKLHTRTWGAGQGGGVFGFFGYTLNGMGKFIEYLVKTCQGGAPTPVGLSSTELLQLFGLSDDPAYRSALMHFTNQPKEQAPSNAAGFAEAYALQYTPGALEKALKSRAPQAARDFLSGQLQAARQRAQASFKALDTAASVADLKAYFDLEALAKRHKVDVPPLALGIDSDKLQLYRAALTWSNQTARTKNIRAMQTELEQLKKGQAGMGNPFWSAKFLASQGAKVDNAQSAKMRKLHPELLAKSCTYKAQVQTLQAWNRMSLTTLWQAIQKNDPSKVRRWIELQFKAWGLPMPVDVDTVLARLKGAKTAHELAVKLLEVKTDTRNHHATALATALLMRDPPPLQPPGEDSNSSTDDTSKSGPPKRVSTPSVRAMTI